MNITFSQYIKYNLIIAALFFNNAYSEVNYKDKFQDMCNEFKALKSNPNYDLSPSEKNNKLLSSFVELSLSSEHIFTKKHELDLFIQDLKDSSCLEDFISISTESEFEMEKIVFKNFSNNYVTHNVEKKLLSREDKIQKFKNTLENLETFKFPYTKNYIEMIAKEAQLLNEIDHYSNQELIAYTFEDKKYLLPNLENYKLVFMGSGFPFSGVIFNILTGVEIELVDYDLSTTNNIKNVINRLSHEGIIDSNDFSIKHLNASDYIIDNNHYIIFLSSSLDKDTKLKLLKSIQSANVVVIDRFVEGIFKIYYPEPLSINELSEFIISREIFPSQIIECYKDTRSIIDGGRRNLNSSRLIYKHL